jgi:DNA-binding GntR family transcriptional regulator
MDGSGMPDPRQGQGTTLAEQLYRKLGDAILAGDLAPGAKINEPALARQYGVSRGPLREALHRLQERKLVTRSANQGARVVLPSADALAEIFVVREALEGMAARHAGRLATDAEIEFLRAAVAKDEAALALGLPGSGDSHDRDFHFMIAQASRNPMLIALLCDELYPLLRLYRGRHAEKLLRSRRALVEHQRILAAIEERDCELAELHMRRHIAAARLRREKALAEQGPG